MQVNIICLRLYLPQDEARLLQDLLVITVISWEAIVKGW